MPQVTILEVREIPSPDLGRVGQKDTLIIYRLDTQPAPRQFVAQGHNLTTAQIETAIRQNLGGPAAHQGKTFTI